MKTQTKLLSIILLATLALCGVAPLAAQTALTPTLSLSPSATTASLQAFTVRVSGQNFSSNSKFVFTDKLGDLQLTPIATGVDGVNVYVDVIIPANRNIFDGLPAITVTNLDGTSAKAILFILSRPCPVIYTLSPVAVPAGAAQFTLTLTGVNFDPGVTVQLNDVILQITSYSATELKVTVPASLGTQPFSLLVVKAINPDTQSGSGGLIVTNPADPLPPITSITPTITTASGKAFRITINNSGIQTGAAVYFGSQELVVVSQKDSQLVATVPAFLNVAGDYTVIVGNTNLSISAIAQFTILPKPPAPAIVSVSPESSTRIAGTTFDLTIRGENFINGATVAFVTNAGANTYSLSVKSLNPYVIIATVPSNIPSGTYSLVVTNPDTQSGTQLYSLNRATGIVATSQIPLLIYPNPASELITVEAHFEQTTDVVITVRNVLGQIVCTPVTVRVVGGGLSYTVPMADVPAGVYAVEVAGGGVERVVMTQMMIKR